MTPVLDLSEPAPEPYRKLVSVTPDNVLYQILNPCWENNNKDLFKEVFWELHSLFNPLNKDLPVGFPSSSDGKESACNSGDPGSIPGLGRSPGGGQGNLLQYSCLENPHGQRSLVGIKVWHTEWGASLVAQMVKNLPAIQETPVPSLGREDSPGNLYSILCFIRTSISHDVLWI